jgi:putative ABC transport system substrate-binding protein
LALLLADLLRRQVALIVGNTPAALAVKAATTTVPIVFVTGGDPIKDGLVAGLNRPGGNVTGNSFFTADLGAKQVGLLRELRLGAAPIAVLVDPKWPYTERFVSELRAAPLAVGQELIVLDVRSDREIETAFTTLVQRGAGALHAGIGGFMNSQRERVVALAARHRIPAIYNWREAVAAGGLMSYAPSIVDAYRQAGVYAGRILKGEKPGDQRPNRVRHIGVFLGLAASADDPGAVEILRPFNAATSGWSRASTARVVISPGLSPGIFRSAAFTTNIAESNFRYVQPRAACYL